MVSRAELLLRTGRPRPASTQSITGSQADGDVGRGAGTPPYGEVSHG